MPLSFAATKGKKKNYNMNSDKMKENQHTISVNKQVSVKVSSQKKPQIQAIKAIVTDMPIRHLA